MAQKKKSPGRPPGTKNKNKKQSAVSEADAEISGPDEPGFQGNFDWAFGYPCIFQRKIRRKTIR